MKLLTSKFRLFALITANLLVMLTMYAADPNVAYSSDDDLRDQEIRDEKWRDARRRDEDRDSQWRDQRRRDQDREDRRREEQRNGNDTADTEGGEAKPIRNLHPELQLATPRNRR